MTKSCSRCALAVRAFEGSWSSLYVSVKLVAEKLVAVRVESSVEMVDRSVVASQSPTLEFDLRKYSDSESTLLNFDGFSRSFGLLLVVLFSFRKAVIAFLRTRVIFSFDFKLAGSLPVTEMGSDLFSCWSLLGTG
jgi:hypothetical protein